MTKAGAPGDPGAPAFVYSGIDYAGAPKSWVHQGPPLPRVR